MVTAVLKFAEFCRASDLMVSTSEVLDCMSHLMAFGQLDEFEFKAALKTNFVKTRRDQRHFNHLYDIFFHNLTPDAISADADPKKINPLKQALQELRKTTEDPHIDAILDFIDDDPLPFLEELKQIQTREQSPSQVVKSNLGALSGRLEIMLRLNQTRGRIMHLLESQEADREGEALRGYVRQRFETAYTMLTEERKTTNSGLIHVKGEEQQGVGLGKKFFSSLSPEEVTEMREVIKNLVRKLKDMVTRRWAKKNRGALDIKKTLRLAGRYQGVPLEVVYKKKPPRKGKIVVLCDISGSVWSAARFMLNMIYSLQDCFSKVRSFVFVSEVAEITAIFERYDVNTAIEKVMSEAVLNYNALTDYGETFRIFRDNYLDSLTRKTTLIIVGDGRTNYYSPRDEILGQFRDKCRRVIWLNPEPHRFWEDGDSEMNTYKAHCHEVRPCQNLNQLSAFIEELVL